MVEDMVEASVNSTSAMDSSATSVLGLFCSGPPDGSVVRFMKRRCPRV